MGGEGEERGADPTRPDQTKQYEKKTMQSLYTIIYCVCRFLLLSSDSSPSLAFVFFSKAPFFGSHFWLCKQTKKKKFKKLNLKANFIQKHLICADRGKKLLQQQQQTEAEQEPGTEIPRAFCRFSADVTSSLPENPTQSSIIIQPDLAPYCCSLFIAIWLMFNDLDGCGIPFKRCQGEWIWFISNTISIFVCMF